MSAFPALGAAPPYAETWISASGIVWPVDAARPDADIPPAGRSLFDRLVLRRETAKSDADIPFPFSALLDRIVATTGQSPAPELPYRAVAIPIGRSLQRHAAAPHYFASPRVVVAFVADPMRRHDSRDFAGLPLKDRLYLGYQAQANVIEVISYNDEAGRFEFQVVRDYRPGGEPKLTYANRAVCIACHQNAAPIFSRPLWGETQANAEVATRLAAQQVQSGGVAIGGGVDVAYSINAATDRANLFSVHQFLWRQGCASSERGRAERCRAALLVAALQWRLSGSQAFDESAPGYRDDALATLAGNARSLWPGGLAIPNPDLPNRDPLVHGLPQIDVTAAFDPLAPRAAREVWPTGDGTLLAQRAVEGLAGFLSDADVRRLDAALARERAGASIVRATLTADCEVALIDRPLQRTRVGFRCASKEPSRTEPRMRASLDVSGRILMGAGKRIEGTLDRLTIAREGERHAELRDIDIVSGAPTRTGDRWNANMQVKRSGARVRGADGSAIESLRLVWRGGQRSEVHSTIAGGIDAPGETTKGRIEINLREDFAPVREAVAALARDQAGGTSNVFGDAPFRRSRVMPALLARLGAPVGDTCCGDRLLPPPVPDHGANTRHPATGASDLDVFFRYCALCHRSSERFPPGFLEGDVEQVRAKLEHCAERLHVRLAMWRDTRADAPKSPMPPMTAIAGTGLAPQAWRASEDLATLQSQVVNILRAQRGKDAGSDDLLQRDYESLRECLPGS